MGEIHRSIVLIGYRGAGKTSVGQALAVRLGCNSIDTDELIVSQAGKSISDIFATDGEVGFRKRECAAIEEAIRQHPGVISVGGGAVLDEQNVQRLKSAGILVFLDAPAEVLWSRVSQDSQSIQNRPALTNRSGLDEIKTVLAQRIETYRKVADMLVETSSKDMEEIVAEIIRRLPDHLAHRADSGQSNQP